MSENLDHGFESLLEHIKRTRGFDYGGYKRMSLMRRFRRRMQQVGVESFGDYTDYLEVHPDEFAQLFNSILINVTDFYRDPDAWSYLASDILPRIQASKKPEEPIRVWSAGTASGEEAYTLAILLAEMLGKGAFCERVKIFATDVDEESLAQGRQATYSEKDVESIAPEILEKCFTRANGHFVFDQELRRAVIFGRHDLVQDAPISRIDLLVCRNTLMYFNAEAQERILRHFHFALSDAGFLFLGKAEMLLSHGNLFTPVDLKRRIFQRVSRNGARRTMAQAPPPEEEGADHLLADARIREAAFESALVPQVVIDPGGRLAFVTAQARALFGLSARDIGRPFRDLEISFRPAELRAPIEQAAAERRHVLIRDVRLALPQDQVKYLDVHVVPLQDSRGAFLGVTIAFADVARQHELQEEVLRSRLEVDEANVKLQSTNEELETTNEELQSTVEELETTNEELQSTNEELETMNEELQSTNEELETLNNELHQRTGELNEVNLFLESILSSVRAGVAVADRDLTVQVWSSRAEDLWGLHADEVEGKHFMNLDIGLPVERLRQPIRACLAGESNYEEVSLDAVTRRGKSIRCKVTCTSLRDVGSEIRGVIILMEEQQEPES